VNRRQLLRGAVAAAVVTGFGAGCTEPPPPARTDLVDPGTPAPAPSPTQTVSPAPLTGAPATSETVATRGALAVPIRVTPAGTPAGLAAADLLFQEYGEADTLHIAAVFQSQDAAKIGPVTEIRPGDVRALTALRPFVAYAGGPTGFVDQFTKSGLSGVTPVKQKAAFTGDYTSTAALYKVLPTGGLPPSPIFSYAEPGTPLAAQDVGPAGTLTVAVPGRDPQVWTFDAQSNTWRGRAGKATVAVGSVMVLAMPYRTLDVRKPSPRSLPSAKIFGEGAATVVSGPFVAKAKWRKPSQRLICNVLDSAGNQIRPLPGATWIVYAPSNAKVTVK
jgi:hypothetical protein